MKYRILSFIQRLRYMLYTLCAGFPQWMSGKEVLLDLVYYSLAGRPEAINSFNDRYLTPGRGRGIPSQIISTGS